ncbi:bifunctional riboflavin kinase/FAD synthetase [soil metagenome]
MRILHGLGALPADERICATVGVFDGLHRGHRQMLAELERVAQRLAATPTVITFDPHPEAIVRGRAPELIMDPDERLERLADAGVGITVVQRFDEAFRRTSAQAFLEQLGAGRTLAGLVMTSESAFGRDRAGTLQVVREMSAREGWEVVEAPTFELRGGRVSSARIRELVRSGRLAAARVLMGRDYGIVGGVVHGDGRGRELGFPTANLYFHAPVCLPPDGILAARASWGGEALLAPQERADAVISLGTRPTFGGGERVFEVHVLDREVDLYGQRLRVELVRHLRGQRRYTSADALVEQMVRDVIRARAVLG